MKTTSLSLGIATACVLSVGWLDRGIVAADGRIPIYQPITITQSGSYVLTRDVVLTSTPLVTVQGNISVSIDMAGHTVTGTGSEVLALVQMDGSPTVQCGSIRLANGLVYRANPIVMGPLSYCAWDVSIDRVVFRNSPLFLYEAALTLTASRFFASSATLYGDRSPGQVLVEHNTFDTGDIDITGEPGVQIRYNVLTNGMIHIRAYGLGPTARTAIEGNSAARIRVNDYGGFNDWAYGVVIVDNIVATELSLSGTKGAIVSGNLVGGSFPGGSGIELFWTSDSVIESNNVRLGDYGIHFDSQSFRNTYRNNVLRSQTTGAVFDEGTGNIDAGGNITAP